VDIRQLRCFVAVAEELHFGRAADRLHVAQPAVSQTIRAIENELGLTLFNRTNRRVALTDAGKSLLEEADAVIDRFDRALATMARVRDGRRAQLRIGAVPALPPSFIPELLATFAAEAPGLTVVVRAIQSGRNAGQLLADGELDVVLVRGEVGEPSLNSIILTAEPVGVALPTTHPLAGNLSITPRDLNSVPLISFSRATDPTQYDQLFNTLAAAGLDDVQLVHESHAGAVDASLRLVESGAGLSLKLASEVDAFASTRIVWRPLTGVALDVVISAAWRNDRVTPPITELLALLRSRLDRPER
jgi:DNA-binding transcriptional LysR family regulator